MTCADILAALEALGTAQTKKTLLRHGAVEPLFGVRIGDLKPLRKQLKGRQDLALALFATGNSDAQYLAGLVADGARMSPAELQSWADGATWHLIAASPVAWVAGEHPDGFSLAARWIESPRALTAIAGWAALAAIVATVPDEQLPATALTSLLDRAVASIHDAPDRVRYAMNNFVIATGTWCGSHADAALAAARAIGRLAIDMGDTACAVPDAESTIIKSRRGAPVAPKRRTMRC